MNTFERPDWREYYLAGAKWVSTRADCRRRRVGAILVAENNKVLGMGYNGTEPGKPGCLSGACPRGLLTYDQQPAFGDYSNCIGIHAEVNCLRNIAFRAGQAVADVWNFNPTMFITDEPCTNCQETMLHAGVFKAVWPEGEIEL